MKRSRFTEEQIIAVLREHEAGAKTADLELEYRALVEEILELRGTDRRVAGFLSSITSAGALADTAGYSPALSHEQKVELLQTLDVVERLQGEANVNLSLGFLLPFVVPVVAGFLSDRLENSAFAQPTALAWLVTAWAFLPASLLMRGVALHRVAGMILAQRQRTYDQGWQPA